MMILISRFCGKLNAAFFQAVRRILQEAMQFYSLTATLNRYQTLAGLSF